MIDPASPDRRIKPLVVGFGLVAVLTVIIFGGWALKPSTPAPTLATPVVKAKQLPAAAWGYPRGKERYTLQATEFYRAGGNSSPEVLDRIYTRILGMPDLDQLNLLALEACAIEQTYYQHYDIMPQAMYKMLRGLNGLYNIIQGREPDGELNPPPRRILAAEDELTEQEDNFCQHPSG